MSVLGVAGVVFALSWWLTRRCRTPGSRLYLLDHPNERSLHQVPTPRTGGVAVLVSAACGFLLTALIGRLEPAHLASSLTSTAIWIAGPATVLAAVSFCDDRWGLPIGLRFGVQVLAALAVVGGPTFGFARSGFPS